MRRTTEERTHSTHTQHPNAQPANEKDSEQEIDGRARAYTLTHKYR